jgi:protein O-mannosyl-transferase
VVRRRNINSAKTKSLFFGAAVLAVLIIAPASIYAPGVKGPFLLDDVYMLSALAHLEELGGLKGVYYYLAANHYGVLGRPIANLSFLLNDFTWPSQPESFKWTNLLLHLMCGNLIFWLLFLLKRQFKLSTNAAILVAGFVAIIWSVHPINVSTTLYVIQRMTILMTLFGLWALLCFVYAFSLREGGVKVHLLMTGFGGLTLMSILCKENGALIPIYALIIGKFYFNGGKDSLPCCRVYYKLFLAAPFILAAYFIIKWPLFLAGYETRDFVLSGRLLTESRVVVDYIVSILIPNKVQATLYYDDISISTNILNPLSTLFSIVALALSATLVTILVIYKKAPVFCFGITWFLVGHLIESTFIPLEIAFEHRNYMPSAGIILLLVYYGWRLLQNIESFSIRTALGGLALVIPVLTALLTHQHALNWSSWPRLIYTWAYYQPESRRAQRDFAYLVAVQGQPDKAIEILEDVSSKYPHELTLHINIDVMKCKYQGFISTSSVDINKNYTLDVGALLGSLAEYMDQSRTARCSEISSKEIATLFDKVKNNYKVKRNSRLMARVLDLEGTYEAELGNYERSMHLLDEAAELQKTVDFPLKQAVILLKGGMYTEALEYVEKGYSRDKERAWRYPSRRDELVKVEEAILNKMGKQNG